jgi:two-component system, OmpR family, response regulator
MTDRAHTVVVVEDDIDTRELIEHSLAMKGFEVHTATTGREGLELVRSLSPDLVTLDLGLPDLDGTEVCRQVRAMSDAYIVMISARSEEVDRLVGLEIGADDYLTKPFSPRELQARVTAMFRRPRHAESAPPVPSAPPAPTADPVRDAAADDALVLGRLRVDVESRSVTIDDAEVELTRTEFELLATMIAAPRRVWGRDVLMRLVWGEGWAADEHLVEVHVGNLRRKLSRYAGSASFIRTVRGVGYRMEEPAAV